MGRKIEYRCHLCNMVGHSYLRCRQYPNESPKETECPKCHGRHVSVCKFPYTKKQQFEGQIAKIMEIFGQQNATYQQQQQPNNNVNGYNPNYNRQTEGYRDYRQQRNGNYQGRRSQSGYRGNGFRPYTPGRSGYKGGYNNNYRPNRSNYNRPQDGQRPYNGNNNSQRPYNSNNGQRFDQKQIQKLEEMVKEMKQQKLNGHVPHHQAGGLGNEGHQPLNAAVVLDVLETTFQ
jgi:hypothetical protein